MLDALEKWLQHLEKGGLPALRENIRAIDRLLGDENVPVDRLASVIEHDPALTVRLLRIINAVKHRHLRGEVTTVTHALMMLGMGRLRQLPQGVPVIEELEPPALRKRLLTCYGHAYHAASQAYDWARLRMDMEPDEVFMCTFLHNIGELLLWRYAPAKMQEIEVMCQHDGMEPQEAQYVVLGFGLDQLTGELARRWGLPSLLQASVHAENAQNPRVLGIMLAVQLARAARRGWYRPATQEVLEQVATFLHRGLDETIQRVHVTAVEAARRSEGFGGLPAAALLLLPPGAEVYTVAKPKRTSANATPGSKKGSGGPAPSAASQFCLMPQPLVLQNALKALSDYRNGLTLSRTLALALEAMHDGIGLNRVVFSMLTPDRGQLRARSIAGSDNDPHFSQFTIDLDGINLFSRLMEKPQALWINDANRTRFWALVPKRFQRLVITNTFLVMSVFVKGKAVGMFYADRHAPDCVLDETGYKRFKRVAQQTARALEHLTSKPEQ